MQKSAPCGQSSLWLPQLPTPSSSKAWLWRCCTPPRRLRASSPRVPRWSQTPAGPRPCAPLWPGQAPGTARRGCGREAVRGRGSLPRWRPWWRRPSHGCAGASSLGRRTARASRRRPSRRTPPTTRPGFWRRSGPRRSVWAAASRRNSSVGASLLRPDPNLHDEKVKQEGWREMHNWVKLHRQSLRCLFHRQELYIFLYFTRVLRLWSSILAFLIVHRRESPSTIGATLLIGPQGSNEHIFGAPAGFNTAENHHQSFVPKHCFENLKIKYDPFWHSLSSLPYFINFI